MRAERPDELANRRLWAGMMLTRRVGVLASILRGLPVVAGELDGIVLRHALRGRPLPPAEDYVDVTDEMLDAVAEAERVLTQQKGKR